MDQLKSIVPALPCNGCTHSDKHVALTHGKCERKSKFFYQNRGDKSTLLLTLVFSKSSALNCSPLREMMGDGSVSQSSDNVIALSCSSRERARPSLFSSAGSRA